MHKDIIKSLEKSASEMGELSHWDSLGSLLKDARSKKHKSRQQVEQDTGISANSLVKYELAGTPEGQFPPLPKLAKLIAYLGIDARLVLAMAAEDQEDQVTILQEDGEKIDLATDKFVTAFEGAIPALERLAKQTDAMEEKLKEMEAMKKKFKELEEQQNRIISRKSQADD